MANLIPGLPNDVASECLMRIPFQSFSSAISTSKDWKREIESSEYVHTRIVAGYSQPIMVMAQAEVHKSSEGGMVTKKNRVPIYRLTACELQTGNWSELPPIPGFPNGLPIFCRLAVVGFNLVVIGGWEPRTLEVSNGVYIYNFVSATWHRGAEMPEARSFFGCSSDSDRMVYVVGGHDEEKDALRSALAYDTTKDEWVRLPDMAMERDECKAFFQRGRLHVINGYSTDAQGHFSGSFEAFDPATWTWGPLQERFMERNECAKTCVVGEDGSFYARRNGDVAMLEKGKWEKVIDLPADLSNSSSGLMAWKNNLVMIGSTRFGETHMLYFLDLETKKWSNFEVPMEYAGHVQVGCCLEI